MTDLKQRLKQDADIHRRKAVRYQLNWTLWNIKRTAEILGVSRQTIYTWIKQFKLKRPKAR